MRPAVVAIVLAVVLLACRAAANLLPARTAEATLSAPVTRTSTYTPVPTGTITPSPGPTWKPPSSPLPTLPGTLGPTLTSTVTPTRVSPAASATASLPVSSELACRLDWQSPGDGWEISAYQKFSAGWKVTNTGGESWEPGSVVFTYLSGAKLHNDPIEPLESRVAPGQSIILTVPMRAPRNSTFYSTYWSLRRGDVFFCRVAVHVYVK